MNGKFLILFFLLANFIFSQELNCEVVVEARQTGNENLQVFKTLQSQLTEFVNNTSWTKSQYGKMKKLIAQCLLT